MFLCSPTSCKAAGGITDDKGKTDTAAKFPVPSAADIVSRLLLMPHTAPGRESYRKDADIMNTFYAMLSRMKHITRWSLMRNVRTENLCEHSQDVAVIAHALALLTNRRFGGQVDPGRCALLALYHDAPEILTGDLPTPVKYYNPALREAYRQVETVSGEKLLSMLPDDLRDDYRPLLLPDEEWTEERRLVKAADKLAALIKCVEEAEQGNREFEQARRSTEQAVRAMRIPAADCFLQEFLPSYRLTLDEQGN